MKKLPDISDWYTDDRCLEAEISWLLSDCHREVLAGFLLPQVIGRGVTSVIEFGCASGFLAAGLPSEVRYLGLDTNEWFLNRARLRCKDFKPRCRQFLCKDVRDPPAGLWHDLALAWDFLKHFSLWEWDTIVARVLNAGRFAAFNMQLADHDLDNGTDFHHVFVTRKRLEDSVKLAGHHLLAEKVLNEGVAEGEGPVKNVAFWTGRE